MKLEIDHYAHLSSDERYVVDLLEIELDKVAVRMNQIIKIPNYLEDKDLSYEINFLMDLHDYLVRWPYRYWPEEPTRPKNTGIFLFLDGEFI